MRIQCILYIYVQDITSLCKPNVWLGVLQVYLYKHNIYITIKYKHIFDIWYALSI